MTEDDSYFAHGKEHDYRVRKLGPEDFIAEQRSRGGAWKELSRGHKNAYIACTACSTAEGKAAFGTHGTEVGRLDVSKTNEVNEPKKLGGLERLRAARMAGG